MAQPDDVNAGTSNGVIQQQLARSNNSEVEVPEPESSLPPVDTGKDAWLFLVACWAVEALVFGEYLPAHSHSSSILTRAQLGFGFSFGVFQDFYSNREPFARSGHIAVIGTTTMVSEPEQLALLPQRLIRTPGNHIRRNTLRSCPMPPLPSSGSMVHADRPLYHFLVHGNKLLVQQRASAYRNTGDPFWHRWLFRLLSLCTIY